MIYNITITAADTKTGTREITTRKNLANAAHPVNFKLIMS